MNSKERVLTAVDRRQPDRVPITFDAEPTVKEALSKHFGVTTKEQLWDALHVDTWFVAPEAKRKLRRQLDDDLFQDAWGVHWQRVFYGQGSYTDPVRSPLRGEVTVEQIARHPWPPRDIYGFQVVRTRAAAQPERAIVGSCGLGVFFIASFVRGMDDLLMDLLAEPERATAVIERIRPWIVHQVKELMRQAGDALDIFYMADDFCMQDAPMMPPATFASFFLPYIREIADIVHEHGCKFLFHCCGSVRPLLPMLIDAGVDILEPIQTRAAGMQVEPLKRDFGDRLAFYGSIDLQKILCEGTPDTVRDEVRRNMRVLGEGGGFILGPGHTYIQPDAPLANILAMYDTAYREGIYR